MASRFGLAVAICLGMVSAAAAQVVRFETTMGDFDMVLNPTNNPRLQAHVNNMVQYVENGNYKSSWINRAVDGFVLQMGGLFSHTKRPPLTIDSTRGVATFAPVPGEPAMETGLSNTVGTVSLALQGAPMNRANQDSGTSSFFINVGDNSSLNLDFTVFAALPDMTVINQIMALPSRDLTDPTRQPSFGVEPNTLTYSDVPIMANGFQVFIKRAFIVTDAMAVAQAAAGAQSVIAQSAASFNEGPASAPLLSNSVPEPASLLTALVAALSVWLFTRRRR